MTNNTLIYKYPNCKSMFETNCTLSRIDFINKNFIGNNIFNPNYLNPHENITKYYYTKEYTEGYFYYLSKHPSNDAIEIMMKDPSIINLDGLVQNTNPHIGHLLEMSLDKFNNIQWSWMCTYSSNPTVMAFLEEHPDKICRFGLSRNICNDAIKILERNQDKIVWCNLSANPSGIDLIKNNLDKIVLNTLCENPNPEAISILQQNLDKINWYYLSSNPGAISILSHNIDKLHTLLFSQNEKAMDVLINHPHLIDNYGIMLNPAAISYVETHLNNFHPAYTSLLARNPNGFQLIEKLLKQGIYKNEYILDLDRLRLNESFYSLYDLDYQAMSKARTKLLRNELDEKAFHPSRISKWLDYHCENGGTVEDFEM